jgi:hypothetical protein
MNLATVANTLKKQTSSAAMMQNGPAVTVFYGANVFVTHCNGRVVASGNRPVTTK